MKWPFCTKGMGSPRCDPSLVPCHQGHLLQDGDSSSSWVTALLSLQEQLLQKHHFLHYHHFLCLSGHLMFCVLSLLSVAVVGQAGAQSWQPRETHSIRWLKAGASCKDLVLGNTHKPRLSSRFCYLLIWERAVEEAAASRAVWQLLHCTGMLADWDVYFFPPLIVIFCFSFWTK